MLTASQLKSLLRSQGIRLTKRLGQHHLIDAKVIERLVESCGLSRHDTVVEIGSGLGALTESLAERAGRVIAVEVDERIARLLAERLRRDANVSIACEDILHFSWERVRGAVVIGAIPYSITSPLIASLCEHRAAIKQAWLLLQQEVAQRLLAKPGTKAYGRLSVLCQYSWQPLHILTVPRSAFFPQPQVDSSWMRLVPHVVPPVAVTDERLFFALVKASFAHRRKTLANCLRTAHLATGTRAQDLLRSLSLSASIRGEALSLGQFALLTKALERQKALC